ncbi:MAG: MFS transporter [Oscillospiraceae bacterium]|nr:MFS transporter [Oscillospiraceae bacterium]
MDRQLLTYSKKERNTYLLSMTGQNILYGILNAAHAYFLQFTVLIPAASIGVFMACARVYDALNDSVMGVIMDRTNTKIGKARPYLIAAPPFILITTILCFWAPFGTYTQASSTGMVVLWAAAGYTLWSMAYTVGDIPLWGITALITEKDADRNKLISAANIVSGVGIGLGFIVQPLALGLAPVLGSEMNAFLLIAVIFALLGSGLFQIIGFTAREKIRPTGKPAKIRENFKMLWSNKPFRQILISGVLGSPKSLIMIAIFPLFTYYYAAKNILYVIVYLALIGSGLFVGQYIAIGSVPKLLEKFSKKILYNYSNLVAVVPSALIFVLYLINPQGMTGWLYVILTAMCFLFVGVGMGVPMVLQSVMIADCVDYQEYQSGLRPDGVFFAGQTFIAKLQAAMATIISGFAFAIVGFSDVAIEKVNEFIEAGGIPRTEPEFQPYMMILFFLVSVPPAIGYLISVLPTWRYALDTAEHKRILEELNARRGARGAEEVARSG